ncbi:hypothetical protein ACJIZ3_015090 [Penstemon smallii]|uniref:F-box domain-containing protein n=1 Tax=Penstemon smallii TaxID=265156 RepID=A0ABD3RLH8_9LAMI
MEASREVASKYSTKIENLSECILIHILSFLTTFDAIRTTLVCHTWRNLWYQVPSLTFDIVPFYIVPFQSSSNTYITTRDKFFQCVNRAISIHPFTHVKKFQLRIDCDDDSHIANVNNWVLHVINSKVIELDIDFDISYINFILSEENGIFYREVGVWKFCFDFSYLKDSSVKVLMLRRSLIHCPPYVCTSDFQSVQSLFFDDLRLKDKEVNDVIKLCVNLEYLTIQFLISAPRLHSVIIDNVWAKVYFLKPSPNLVVAKVEYYNITVDNYSCWCHFMSTLATTKYLTVRNMYFVLLTLTSWQYWDCFSFGKQFRFCVCNFRTFDRIFGHLTF